MLKHSNMIPFSFTASLKRQLWVFACRLVTHCHEHCSERPHLGAKIHLLPTCSSYTNAQEISQHNHQHCVLAGKH